MSSHQPHQQVPVHGELCHEGDIGGVEKGQEIILQEEEVDAVLREVLLPEVIAGIVLIQLLQRLLQLQRHEGEGDPQPHGELGRLRGVCAHPVLWGWGAELPPPHLVAGRAGQAGAAEELPAQQVPVVLQEGQVEVAEELHVLVLHPQLLGRVPVDHLRAAQGESAAPSAPQDPVPVPALSFRASPGNPHTLRSESSV